MKRVIYLLIFICISILPSCDSAVSQGREVYKAYFNHILKDPDSFKVYSEKYSKDGEYTVKWDLDYGAKNSFGGMIRKQVSFETIGTKIHIEGDFYDIKDFK